MLSGKNHTNKTVLIVFFIMVMLHIPHIAAAKIAWLPLDKLVALSVHIVIAQVQAVSVVKSDSKTGIITLKNNLTVIESLKGSWPKEKPLVLTTTKFANPAKYWEEDNVELPSAGSKVLLFLEKVDRDMLLPANGIQGVWPMMGDEPVGAGTGTSLDQVREIVQKQVNMPISAKEAKE